MLIDWFMLKASIWAFTIQLLLFVIIMRGIVKSTHSSTVEDIFKIAKDVNKEEYKYQENFRKVVETAFGKEKEKGILSDRL